ncbi:hypothetical protein [Aliivibrio fischeri]|uniref:hypothetical protein n=1 Tax=Aliivibrio fischeri TaxID=668 RepID=UPI0012D8FA84|nr:hypothetical protein [Aliivibrio fischeri]MUJ20471.1 hypothetical protein [Aliivibrio fischeri]
MFRVFPLKKLTPKIQTFLNKPQPTIRLPNKWVTISIVIAAPILLGILFLIPEIRFAALLFVPSVLFRFWMEKCGIRYRTAKLMYFLCYTLILGWFIYSCYLFGLASLIPENLTYKGDYFRSFLVLLRGSL